MFYSVRVMQWKSSLGRLPCPLCVDYDYYNSYSYDIVLDCTDNVATRYLLNDACVLLDKPLVSGSALRFEGQLTVYHYNGGPCYRCLFPEPPPPGTVTSCSEGGVMGPGMHGITPSVVFIVCVLVPGVIGTMQALEVLKMVSDAGSILDIILL